MNRRQAAHQRHERVVEADRRWFDRHPHRQFRLRHVSEVEFLAFRLEGHPLPEPQPGYRWWVIAKVVAPGCRFKAHFIDSIQLDPDQPDVSLAALYRVATGERSDVREAERAMGNLYGARGSA